MNKNNKNESVDKKDLKIKPYKGKGNGGQKRNKTMSACRVVHEPTGVTVTIDGR